MDTLIKGLKTPKSCYSETYSEQGNCWFFFYDFKGGCHCSISDCKCLKTKLPKGCPLVELPPHGELVQYLDVKNAIVKAVGKDNPLWCDIMDVIDAEAPTVLEASK